ncbi:hypothetical protein SAMN04488128_1021617 [Chitinophaga eiseniae]|uniref:Uncharacterized protein n=1 Tax=Chitinophaga eiseniae TaxID=634771 RepID=A0A1T4RZB3_9BACT|nr:hypothetical protein [Chitinophaga eiseniae]SKA21350.1 hypothetical protein SAMN04488128_1021617 [Chitinophaga eiseniae]
MNSPEIPLHQANPELFKTYLLDHTKPDEILMVKGVTMDDHLLKSELHIKVIIRFLTEASIEFKKTTAVRFLSRLRRRIRSFLRSPRMATAIRKTERSCSPTAPVLYKLYPALFEQLMLEDLRSRPDTDDIPGITQWDRMLRIEIVLFILDDEIIRLCAYVRQQSVQAVRAEHRRKVDRVLAAYGRLLPANQHN